jgi:plastocyanin
MNTDSTSGPGDGPAAANTEPSAAVVVSIQSTKFVPDHVSIRVGQKVRWVNSDTATHIVSSNPGAHGCQPPSPADFLSYDLHPNDAFEYLFAMKGVYHYHCLIKGCSMSGSVTVS